MIHDVFLFALGGAFGGAAVFILFKVKVIR